MITPDKIRTVCATLLRVLPYTLDGGGGGLDLMETNVSAPHHGHACGTIHCHAGWYAVAKEWDGVSTYLRERRSVTYSYGAGLMAWDLDFDSVRSLEAWAGANPAIWGNPNGAGMFHRSDAFGPDPDLVTLEDIITHWASVADRLETYGVFFRGDCAMHLEEYGTEFVVD